MKIKHIIRFWRKFVDISLQQCNGITIKVLYRDAGLCRRFVSLCNLTNVFLYLDSGYRQFEVWWPHLSIYLIKSQMKLNTSSIRRCISLKEPLLRRKRDETL